MEVPIEVPYKQRCAAWIDLHEQPPRGAFCQSRTGTGSRLRENVIVLGRTYLVMYTDGRGQAQTERGRLVALDQDGFVVLEANSKHVLIPKARVDALVEVE